MTNNNDYNRKKEIIDKLFLKEEDVIAKLERLVKLAESFLKIEANSNRVILNNEFDLTNSEKIFLILLGKYLAFQHGSIQNSNLKLKDISEELGSIPVTTLSSKASILKNDRIIIKPTEDTYQVNPHEIEKFLKKIYNKYVEK